MSFYTFQKIAYLVDVRARKAAPVDRASEFLLFVCFFPRVLAGPIVKAADFMAQLAAPWRVSRRDVGEAVFLILTGLVKKAVIADYLGVNFVDRVFAAPTLCSGVENLLAVYGYAFQIYGDFSGYTDIALGLGRLVGFRLPPNFDAPYRARSVTDFWRRWHMTLSAWLKEHVSLPVAFALSHRVGAERVLGVKTELVVAGTAALLTWLACGLWHGAAWGFLVWGALHGLAVTVEQFTRWPRRMSAGRLRGGCGGAGDVPLRLRRVSLLPDGQPRHGGRGLRADRLRLSPPPAAPDSGRVPDGDGPDDGGRRADAHLRQFGPLISD